MAGGSVTGGGAPPVAFGGGLVDVEPGVPGVPVVPGPIGSMACIEILDILAWRQENRRRG